LLVFSCKQPQFFAAAGVFIQKNNPLARGVEKQSRANRAWLACAIQRVYFKRVLALEERILLRVHGKAVVNKAKATAKKFPGTFADLTAVKDAFGTSVVTG
jgi:hypothetical protein